MARPFTFVNGTSPALSDDNLNSLQDQVLPVSVTVTPATAVTITWTQWIAYASWTLAQNTTVTIAGPFAGPGAELVMRIKQADAGGPYTVAFAAGSGILLWHKQAFSMTATAGQRDVVVLKALSTGGADLMVAEQALVAL